MPGKQVGIVSVSNKYSSTDFEHMRGKKLQNIFSWRGAM
jgi:hypothetical protein